MPANTNRGFISIEDQKENWSEWTLEDGTKLRVRPVVTEVRRMKHLGLDGMPVYHVKTAFVTHLEHVE
jgi:hypothetical protein